jgi:hypothetical protein
VTAARLRLLVDIVLTFLCGLAVVLILANLSSPARPFAVLIAAVLGSGWALSGWIRLPNDAAYVGTVALGIGFAVPLGLGVLLVESGSWHPLGDMAALIGTAGLVNLALLVRDARKVIAE